MSKLLLILALLINQGISLYGADAQTKSESDSSANSTPNVSPLGGACVARQLVPSLDVVTINFLIDTDFGDEEFKLISDLITQVSADDLNETAQLPLTNAAKRYMKCSTDKHLCNLETIMRLLLIQGANPEKFDVEGKNFLAYLETCPLLKKKFLPTIKGKEEADRKAKQLKLEYTTPKTRRVSMERMVKPLSYNAYDEQSKKYMGDILEAIKASCPDVEFFMKMLNGLYQNNTYNPFLLELWDEGPMYRISDDKIEPGTANDFPELTAYPWN